jgi:hypothetical protein
MNPQVGNSSWIMAIIHQHVSKLQSCDTFQYCQQSRDVHIAAELSRPGEAGGLDDRRRIYRRPSGWQALRVGRPRIRNLMRWARTAPRVCATGVAALF